MAWASTRFRLALVAGVVWALMLAAALPSFFRLIEVRPGGVPFEPLLVRFAAREVALPVFLVLYFGVSLGIALLAQRPVRLLHMVWAYGMLLAFRMVTMFTFTLEPPAGIIPLEDPVTAMFYPGGTPFLKDLFFSGHTATLVLFGLAVGSGTYRRALWGMAAVVGALVLVQHVHYTVDVVAAPVFAVLAWWVACRILGRLGAPLSDGAGA